ncbi:response regulator transcription factor [Ruminococcus flavefaciens]|uniref:response regulator transcription factor n=1 Tax=Ruminococcus flavefaciens TaxID=1265 RepID=UPI0002F5225B|nr:response regulator transcription factor [Ruminococcus flavefaciens]
MKNNILIIDDDTDLSFVITDMLEGYGYNVTSVESAGQAFEILCRTSFDLILLDINLPDFTGFEVCKELRSVSNVPVIFASARTSESDRITGFDIGGDDYLPKPYSMAELFSPKALLRRAYGNAEEQEPIVFGNVRVDISSRSVTKNGVPVALSLKEFDLLACLCEHTGTAVSKEDLFSAVWGTFSDVEPSTLAVHIRWLREKIEDDPASPRYIKTVYKIGYKLEAE